jgi:fructuronate reductase/mannitol 2-dehydrogenase
MDDEVTPLLPQPDGIDLDEYKRTLVKRFGNPAIADTLARLCRRGSTKMPHHLLPSLRQALDEGRPHGLLALALAGWLRHLRGTDPEGRPVPIDDPRAATLQPLAEVGGCDPRPVLGVTSVFGDLGERPELVAELADLLERLDREGVRATVGAVVADRAASRH